MIHEMEERKEKKSWRITRMGRGEKRGRGQELKVIPWCICLKKTVGGEAGGCNALCPSLHARLGLFQLSQSERSWNRSCGWPWRLLAWCDLRAACPTVSPPSTGHHERASPLGTSFSCDTVPTKWGNSLSHDQLIFLEDILLDLFQVLAICWGSDVLALSKRLIKLQVSRETSTSSSKSPVRSLTLSAASHHPSTYPVHLPRSRPRFVEFEFIGLCTLFKKKDAKL